MIRMKQVAGLGVLFALLLAGCSKPPSPSDIQPSPYGYRPGSLPNTRPKNPQKGPLNVCQMAWQETQAAQTTPYWQPVTSYPLQVINGEDMKPETATHLCQDVGTINGFSLDHFSEVPQFWEQVFGPGPLGLQNYLNQRVHFVSETDAAQSTSGQGYFVASNIGTGYFFTYLENFQDVYRGNYSVNGVDQWLTFEDPRVGYISLYPGYNTARTQGLNLSVSRLGTLVHEGRHSDCTGGIARSSLTRYQQTRDEGALMTTQCGHVHVRCPQGHDLANSPACDGRMWEAYGVGALFSKAFVSCKDCSEEERQVATYEMSESLNRIDPRALEQFNSGNAPPPDMSSEVKIIENQ